MTGCSILVGLLAAAALAAGCGGGASQAPAGGGQPSVSRGGGHHAALTDSGHKGPPVVISARRVSKFGEVLVNSHGYALYMFQPDKKSAVTCTQLCAGIWPPVEVPAGASVEAGAGVRQSLLGSDPDPAGGRVATYGGWPLYAYGGDSSPGQPTGEGVDIDGGYWFLMLPSGQPLMGAKS